MRVVGKIIVFLVVLAVGIWLAAWLTPLGAALAIGWLVLGTIGWLLGQRKGHGAAGLLLAILFGPIGLLVVAVMEPSATVQVERESASAAAIAAAIRSQEQPGDTRACPWCAETIKAAAVVCRYCGRDVEPVGRPHDGRVN